MRFEHIKIRALGARSLCWEGDQLVDWAAGGVRYNLDGTSTDPAVNYAYRFDAAVASPSGRFVVLYERLGTKGLVLENGKILREINRSFYCAHTYEYPVALFALRDGTEVLAHCPKHYNQIEFETARDGEPLTRPHKGQRKPGNFFHSRLCTNKSGTRLISRGWIWHPLNVIQIYNIADAFADPSALDVVDLSRLTEADGLLEETNACFADNDHLLISSGGEYEEKPQEIDDSEVRLEPRSIGCYDLFTSKFTWYTVLDRPAGTLMMAGPDHVIDFHQYPKLIDLDTGDVVKRWEGLNTGRQLGSIVSQEELPRALALDPERVRFAVVNGPEMIVVVRALQMD